MNQEATQDILSFTEHKGKQLYQIEDLIERLETHQQNEDVSCPDNLSNSLTTPPHDFWQDMSRQLSYIDGSSVSSVGPSYGRSVSWNLPDLDVPPSAPRSLDSLDGKHHGSHEKVGLGPLSSLTPLARHASDSLCSPTQSNWEHHGGLEMSNTHRGVSFKRPLKPVDPFAFDPSTNNATNCSGQYSVVKVHKSDIKTQIQKRLSFDDTLDMQTTIYTPVTNTDDDCYFDSDVRNTKCSSKLYEKGFSEGGSSCEMPPLIRRSSMANPHCHSLYMDKDLRYYFQHPWFRLFVAYLVIFCNFLLFAEDPVSHSHAESSIPIVGNVFSFVVNKYPTEWYWKAIKVSTWLVGILCGMLVGKVLIHGIFFKRMLRLKMFRDEQGSWMTMFLTVIISLYMFSYVYNLILLIGHWDYITWQIDRTMGVTNENMMKAAATCTWLGDLVTALMVTDMMLQDTLYPHWIAEFRRLYRLSNVPRILFFWCGSCVVATLVIFLIVSDYISWDNLNKGFVETTELSRAFLASFILVMDLLIMMQDWDFPHFTATIDVNLPGFSTHTLHWRYAETKVTGKWFNYGIIFMVMLFDLNMWKNQIFYYPEYYGQYIDPVSRKVFTVENEELLWNGNDTLWTWNERGNIDPMTGIPYRDHDMFMYSRYMEYDMYVKCTAFIPNILGVIMLFTLVTLYGRFPPTQDGTRGGRLLKRNRSSWRRERRTTHDSCSCSRERHGTGSENVSSNPNINEMKVRTKNHSTNI